MKANFKKQHLMGAALAVATLSNIPAARADVSYDSSAVIGYTINSIISSNPNNPGDLSGLSISGSFQQLTDTNDFYAYTSGDGSYLANSPNISPTAIAGNNFNGTFSVSGDSAAYGTVDTLHTGVFSLDLTNTGTNSFNIDVTMGYELNAVAGGVYANSSILLDYWDSNNTLSGFDYVGAGTYTGYGYDNQAELGSAELVYTLAPGATESLIVQAAIQSSLDSTSTSPVPLPAAFWFFASGLLGMIGSKKTRHDKA